MSPFAIALAILIVILALKPAFIRARQHVRSARYNVAELRRRKQGLSAQIRILARESLGQRLTAGKDEHESGEMNVRIAQLQRRVSDLEKIDRRVLVMDERRGLQETGWVARIRRDRAGAHPLEPALITRLWDEGRYYFFYATDANKARRKAQVRFVADQGFEVVDVLPHSGDLTEDPKIPGSEPKDAEKKESA